MQKITDNVIFLQVGDITNFANTMEIVVVECLTSPFQAYGDALLDLVSCMPEPAHIKDSQEGSYLFSNQSNLSIYGLSETDQILGRTVQDLDSFMQPFWGLGFSDEIERLDKEIIKNRQVVQDKNRVFLDRFGLIHIQNMVKSPVMNHNNRVVAVLTMSFEQTEKTNKFKLYELYKGIYKRKSKAIDHFMDHLKIKYFFSEPLTEKELICLLYMRINRCYKSISSFMNISVKTVESHISSIMRKCKDHKIHSILEFLRDERQ